MDKGQKSVIFAKLRTRFWKWWYPDFWCVVDDDMKTIIRRPDKPTIPYRIRRKRIQREVNRG